MKKRTDVVFNKRRLLALFAVMALALGGYAVRLFTIQIVDGDYYADAAFKNTTTSVSIAASRGEILDRYMQPLAVNRTTYSVVFDYNYFPKGDYEDQLARRNAIILELTQLLDKAGESWNDTLPISQKAPYRFEKDREGSVSTLKKTLRLADYATASNCMDEMIRLYGLQSYTPKEQRRIAGVQYEISIRAFSTRNAFYFSDDVSKETATAIEENSRTFVGVDIQTTPVREYVGGRVGCHLIGSVGPIYASEYADLKEKGYSLNDTVGKSGIELAMEDTLRGKTGTRSIVKDSSGNIVEEFESQSAVPGDTVLLTLDSDLQLVAQNACVDELKALHRLHSSEKGHDAISASAVMLDIKDGGVLVCASGPDFNLTTYQKNYAKLIEDSGKPLFNRALNGVFVCGSVFKPAVALAALNEGVISGSTRINCTRKYTYYDDYQPSCLHRDGPITVTRALCVSCNYFFFETSRRLGIKRMNTYCTKLGLGQKSGIEIGEASGTLAGPAEREAKGGVWNPGDTLSAGIGQSDNVFTPMQLAAYTMTIANEGKRYKTHLVYSTVSYDGTCETVVKPKKLATIKASDSAWATIKRGMYEAANSSAGTVYKYFSDAPYKIAGKSGTAQTGIRGASDHSVLIAYAPADKPEVALAVLVERGGGAASKNIARKIFDAYFSAKKTDESEDPIGTLLP